MRNALPPIEESLSSLKRRLKATRDPWRRPRLQLLILLKSGQATTRQAAAEHLFLHRHTIARWLSTYQEGGLSALLSNPSSGPKPGPRCLDAEAIAALEARLEYPPRFRSYGAVQAWIRNELGVEVPYSTVYRLLRCALNKPLT